MWSVNPVHQAGFLDHLAARALRTGLHHAGLDEAPHNANRPARGRGAGRSGARKGPGDPARAGDCFYAAAGSGSVPFAAAPVAVTSGSTSGGPPATESAGWVAASPGAFMPTAS